MDRTVSLERVCGRSEPWDIVVIGGGATGAGCALDAATRGFDALLLEQHDFGKGTSSRSTKLIHGGVRYLRQGNISLVREALKERGILLKNAPHVVHKQAFIIPCYGLWEKLFYGLGMKIYDRLAGSLNLESSRILSRGEVLERLRNISHDRLTGGVLYYDGQFDDTRLLIDILKTADAHGAVVLNYCKVTGIQKNDGGRASGVLFEDVETGSAYSVSAKAIVNATGVFSDRLRTAADAETKPVITFSQGIHLVFDRKFLPRDAALMVPKTSDGRVLFCIPWHGRVLAGTTDTPVDEPSLEPRAMDAEIDFVLETAANYLAIKPTRDDILSVFAGIRPLVTHGSRAKTSSLSRSHELLVDPSGLVTITGGKWTTYRLMAEDAVDKAVEIGGLEDVECRTVETPIRPPANAVEHGQKLHPDLPYTPHDVIRAIREEMARTVEDVLARRTRALFLDTRAAIEIAETVAKIMAKALNTDAAWIAAEVEEFNKTAENYLAR